MAPAMASVMPAEAEAVTKPASAPQPGDDGAGLALQVVDLDELGQQLGDGPHRLRHHDRGAERRHGARHVDDRPQAQAAPDVARASMPLQSFTAQRPRLRSRR